MGDLQVVSGIKKLNCQNYNTWSLHMEAYLQGQDLWEIVKGNKVTQPEDVAALKKWKIKAGKALFVIQTTVEDEMLEHIMESKTVKEAWDTFASLFTKKNDVRLKLLENELLSITQRDMMINQYFTKIKSLCRGISALDSTAGMSDSRIRRIVIHGLKVEYRSFIDAIQGWSSQPSPTKLENLLADQEALAKQLSGVSIKSDEEALFSSNKKGRPRPSSRKGSRRYDDKDGHHGSSQTGRAQKKYNWGGQFKSNNKFDGKCYNYGKKGHIAKNCWSKKKTTKGNVVMSNTRQASDEEWDVEASFAVEEGELALAVTVPRPIDYNNDWIIDSGCSNHMTGDKEKLQSMTEYNSRLMITHIVKTKIVPRLSTKEVSLQDV
ncbi:uncharacterized protein LOC133792339 [Humulus lupulus]|uniref:uncharacterized protein LOC133792339 n=1 Tax=Humulus lupulus TaxID=3486 RepID=UPI002B408F15|nr:uncharacterized protein LOC133792339 [Humulus lupulus]